MRAILIAALAATTSALFLGACTTTPTDEQKADFARLAKEQGRLAELMLGLVGEH